MSDEVITETPANAVANGQIVSLDTVETEIIDQRMLGVTLKVRVPKTVEAFDALAGKPGACLKEGIDNIIFRGVLTKSRAAFCAAVEAGTKIPRKTKEKGKTKDAAGNEVPKFVFDETEGDYIERVLATLATQRGVTEVPESELQPYADALGFGGTAEVKFDPRAKEPGEAAKPAKRYMTAAQEQIVNGGLKPKWVATHHIRGGLPDGSDLTQEQLDSVSVEDIARKISELTLAEERAKSANRFLG